MANWHVRHGDGDAVGPIGTDLVVRGLMAGRVPLDALVRREGDERWTPVARVAEFREAALHAGRSPARAATFGDPERAPSGSGPTSAPPGRRPSEVLVARPSAERQPLGPLERRVVSMLDGVRSIEEVSVLVGLTARETTSISEYLVALGVAAFVDRPEAVEVEVDDSIDPGDDGVDAGWDAAAGPRRPQGA